MTTTITALTTQATILDTTYIPVETASVTGKIAASQLKTYLSGTTLTSITAGTGTINGDFTVSGGTLYAGAVSAASLSTTGDVTVGGAITVNGVAADSILGPVTMDGDVSVVNGNIGLNGNVTCGNLISTGAFTTIRTPSQLYIATLSNVTVGNILATNTASNIGAPSVYFHSSFVNKIYGTLQTASQTNITAVGTLTGLTVAGTGLAVNSSSGITTDQTTFFLANTTATTVNEYGAATTIRIGSTAGANILPTGNAVTNLGSSSYWFNSFYGTSSHALYADLAEKYESDEQYAPGTVLVFGDETEVTISMTANDTRVAGVVSTDPAYLMNGALENGVAVALQGRVPCKVIGPVKRGDLMVTSDSPGIAMVNNNPQIGSVIGKAVGTHSGEGIGLIEVVVGRI